MPGLNELAKEPFDETRTYADVVHLVHIYVTEPHPMGDPSPYTGFVREIAPHSTRRQPTTYAERVALATEIAALLEGEQTMLVDDLAPMDRSNPVWCSYGPMPNSAFLIAMDGTLRLAQKWTDAGRIQKAIDELLGPPR